MTDINYIEVGFNKYCPLCKYEKLIETNEPCNWVIENPIAAATIIGCASSCVSKREYLSYSHNKNSEKPVLFAEK